MKFAAVFLFFVCLCYHTALAGDSLGIKQINHHWYIIHRVSPGAGLYGISRHYHVGMDEIMNCNPELKKGLRAGQILLIPYQTHEGPSAMAIIRPPVKALDSLPVYYTVENGVTLYHIAQKYGISVISLRKWNHLSGNEIYPLQRLIVGYSSNDNLPPTAKKDSLLERIGKEKRVDETVLATAIVGGENLALHRTAPPGTLIKITNPMNQASAVVKVVGNFPTDMTRPGLTIKITHSTAAKLGIRDDYFRLETQYGSANPPSSPEISSKNGK